jgi:hypothetical protein
MKKLFILFVVVFLLACQTLNNVAQTKERNPNCQDVAEVKVFQTLDGYALASVCDYKGEDYCLGMTVRVDEFTEPLYDKKRISAPKGKCIVFTDTYKYETKDESVKTVPVIGFEYEYEATTEDEAIVRAVNDLQDIKKSCVMYMGKEYKDMPTEEKEEKCGCIIKESFEATHNKTKLTRKSLEKKCGKVPKNFI